MHDFNLNTVCFLSAQCQLTTAEMERMKRVVPQKQAFKMLHTDAPHLDGECVNEPCSVP